MNKKDERKTEKAIHEAFVNLRMLMGIYISDRQIERGDMLSAEEVFKRLRKKFQFKLTEKDKEEIKNTILTNISGVDNKLMIANITASYVFGLLENRDEVFKRKLK